MNNDEYQEHIRLKREKWERSSTAICITGNRGHDWMPIAWKTAGTSKLLSRIMCGKCFKILEIDDCVQFRKDKD